MYKLRLVNAPLFNVGEKQMSITVSKTVYSMMKRDLDAKKKKLVKMQAEIAEIEKTFKSVKVIALRKRK